MSIRLLVHDFARDRNENLFVNAVDTVSVQEILVAVHILGRQSGNHLIFFSGSLRLGI